MHIYNQEQTRAEYFATQIAHSRKKFTFCKVSVACVQQWKKVITRCKRNIPIKGPILCLATRNGRDIDVFRNVFSVIL